MVFIFIFANLLLVKQKEKKNSGTHEDVFKESALSEKKNHLAGSQQFAGRFGGKKKQKKVLDELAACKEPRQNKKAEFRGRNY